MTSHNINKSIKIITDNHKCYTRLSIGGEDNGHQEDITLIKNNKKIVKFNYWILWHYTSVKDALECVGNVVSYMPNYNVLLTEVNNCVNIIKYENIIEKTLKTGSSNITNIYYIIQEFIKYISNKDGRNNILYLL